MSVLSTTAVLLAFVLMLAACATAYEAGDTRNPWQCKRQSRVAFFLGVGAVLAAVIAGRFYG